MLNNVPMIAFPGSSIFLRERMFKTRLAALIKPTKSVQATSITLSKGLLGDRSYSSLYNGTGINY
ncbi:MAG: hypothetical protein ACM3JQ_06300 [Candidatus Eiseniibacteriota bacterium]